MTRVAAALVLALGAILACVGLAGASSHGYATRATIKQVDEDTYNGRVFSSRDECVGHRKIELWKQFAGPNQKIDTFKADAEGHWSYDVLGSQFYVIAKRKTFGPEGHLCREDRSRTV
jgi:hypothetical protein